MSKKVDAYLLSVSFHNNIVARYYTNNSWCQTVANTALFAGWKTCIFLRSTLRSFFLRTFCSPRPPQNIALYWPYLPTEKPAGYQTRRSATHDTHGGTPLHLVGHHAFIAPTGPSKKLRVANNDNG